MRGSATAPDRSGDYWRQRKVTGALLSALLFCTILFGCFSTANVVTMAARGGDHAPLIIDLVRMSKKQSMFETVVLAAPRYLFHSFVALTPSELLFSAAIIISSGMLERALGSVRYAQVVLEMLALRLVVHPAISCLLKPLACATRITPSVVWLIVAIHFTRRTILPSTRRFFLLRIPLCYETVADVIMVQLLLIHRKAFTEDLAGLGIGFIVSSSMMAIHRRRIWLPERLVNFLEPKSREAHKKYLSHAELKAHRKELLEKHQRSELQAMQERVSDGGPQPPPPSSTVTNNHSHFFVRPSIPGTSGGSNDDDDARGSSVGYGGTSQRSSASPQQQASPPRRPAIDLRLLEQNVEQMEAMGFDGPTSRAALLRHRNNIDAAVSQILEG